MVDPVGGFVLVYVATPLEVCEQRDRKGLYAKARAGILSNFTGISDPYEPPADAELVLDSSRMRPSEAVIQVLNCLETAGHLRAARRKTRRGKGVGENETGAISNSAPQR